MKVALISTSTRPTPPERYGGIERVVHQLAEALTRGGDDVTVYAQEGSKGGAYALVEKRPDVPYPPVAELRAFDAVGLHDTGWPGKSERLGPWLTLRETLRYGRAFPTVYTFHHGLPYWVRPIRAAGLWPRRLFTTTPSPREGAYAQRHGLRKVVHVPNPVEDGTFRDAADKTDAVCFVAALTPRKAPDFAIQVAREAGRPIVLAGPNMVPDFVEAQVKPQMAAHPDARYVGEITAQEKDDLLSRSAALIHPTRGEEPFGLVVAEAIVRGTPVLASDAGAPRAIIEQTGGGRALHRPDDPKVWAAVLDDMLAQPLDRRMMRDRCLAQFGEEAVARQYRDVLQRARGA